MDVGLPASCARPILERFLRAEAMAMYSVRSAREGAPERVLPFLRRHDAEEMEHLREFEQLTGIRAREKVVLPRMPQQWHARAVHLYGYEALGLEFARLLSGVRPDLAHILADEEIHVGFFEQEVRRILEAGRGPANGAREYARAWMRRLPKTLDRYLRGEELDAYRDALRTTILAAIEGRFRRSGLLAPTPGDACGTRE